MVTFPKYKSYKDSGVEWLCEIPQHWEKWKISHLFTLGRGRVIDKGQLVEDGEYPVYSSQTKEQGIFGYLDSYDFDGEYITWTTDGANAGTVYHHEGKFNCTNVCGTLKPNQNNLFSKYVAYALNLYTPFFVRHDINPKLMNDVMSKIQIFIPTLDEQKRIANFLDRKTSEIDQAIAQKQRLIELLQQQKAILINQAVTKGLDPNVPMRDSGIEWIGKIPEHWDVQKLKYTCKIFRGKFTYRPRNAPHLYDGQYPFIQTGDIAKAGKFLIDYKQTLNEKGLKVSTLIPKGTVIITIAANIGDISILGIDACFPDSVVGFQPQKELERDFLYYVLLSMKQQFINTSTKNTQMNLNIERIGSNFITIPSLSEQYRIIAWIESQILDIEKSNKSLQKSINLLHEYKSILIASAVTGKTKV